MLPDVQNILYATDMGPGSSHVFRNALSLARQYKAKVAILHIIEPLNSFALSLINLQSGKEKSDTHQAKERQLLIKELRIRLHEFCGKEACVAEENLIDGVYVLEGQPAQTIIQQAKQLGSDMIVMGTHCHSAEGETILGSTAQKVLHRGTVPTLLVRVPEQEESQEAI